MFVHIRPASLPFLHKLEEQLYFRMRRGIVPARILGKYAVRKHSSG